jgi:DNA repair exonuclease SbcCD ATPase subunit
MNFRINSITLEGFKGFTNKQTISINGKNLFIFGPNGYGKSSIIEAIRWCLFGLTGRPEERVRNLFYSRNCFVELELRDENNKLWKVQRVLSPGVTHSRPKILDPEGNEKTQTEVFPFLTSLETKEGTYIVFGGPSQFPSRKRPLESIEISDFDRTIYAYLRLEELPELIEKLNKLIKEQKEEENQLAEEIDQGKRKIERELEEVNERLTSILRAPPWGDSEPPTWEQTKEKIKDLIIQLGQEIGQIPPEGLSENELLDFAERWLQELAIPEEEELNRRISEIKEKQKKIKELQNKREEEKKKIENIRKEIDERERKCQELLGDKNLDNLHNELENLEKKIEQTSLLIEIIKKSQLYLENNRVEKCFICLSSINEEEVKRNIKQDLENIEPSKLQFIQQRDELKNLLEKVTRIDDELRKENQILQKYEEEYQEIKRSLWEILGLEGEELTPEKIESILKNLEKEKKDLEGSLESKEEYRRNWERKLEEAKEEMRFHRLRSKKEKLELRLQVGLKPVEESYAELVEFRESLEDIRDVLYSELKKVLEDALPPISEMMTEVYKHLTDQLSFDLIKLKLEEQNSDFSPKLLVRVASSDEPDLPLLDPEQVLNGQALNALRLVPYFVFSRFQRDSWGLDLLLLDDPTQSFDVQRIELLLEELGAAATHAQIIISTHEEDRFRPLLSKFFKKENTAIVSVKGFDKKGGPHLEIE